MKNLKNYLAEKSLLKNLPANPGVYIFKTSDYQPIYVGKAKNLKNRLTSYFFIQLLPKTRAMVGEAKYISYIPVASEFEAFLLEANLVRKLMPKYNIQLKDDKTPLYIIISKEEFPRVITARKTDLAKIKAKKIFGPYLSSLVVKKVISRLRRVFPHSSHKLGKRACIYSQIGLCVPCPNEIIKKEGFERNKLKKEYLKNIANLSKVLEGKHKSVLKDLERKMKAEAKNENFEAAGIYKNQIRQLNYLSQPRQDSSSYLENPSLVEDLRKKELKATKNLLNKYFQIKSLDRIECFDIAHLAGSPPTASMVTFTQGEPDKRLYRHFKVKTKLKGDTDRLKEILERKRGEIEDIEADNQEFDESFANIGKKEKKQKKEGEEAEESTDEDTD